MEQGITLRFARPEDGPELLSIYRPYVMETAVSFEYDLPSEGEFCGRIAAVQVKFPYLVAERGGVPVGYAYAAPFIGRAAYDWTAEPTIYLRREERGRGTGRALYAALEELLCAMGICTVTACVGVPEEEDVYLSYHSLHFHRHLGFREVGLFRNCGCKFGRWYHMAYLEKTIAERQTPPPGVRSIHEVVAEGSGAWAQGTRFSGLDRDR